MASERIEAMITRLVNREAGYVNHPSDTGGPTNWGITEGVARDAGWAGPMQDLPKEFARSIYYNRYVHTPWFDRVGDVSPMVGEELVDTGVNMGPGIASIFFQRWLNVFNMRGKHYVDLFVDGRIGNNTVKAFIAYLGRRGEEGERVMVAALNAVQGNRYLDIAEQNVTQEDFIYGWVRARVLMPADGDN